MSDRYKNFKKKSNQFLESTYQQLVNERNKSLIEYKANYCTVVDTKTVQDDEKKKDNQTFYDTTEYYTINDTTKDNKFCSRTTSAIVTFNPLEKPDDKEIIDEKNAYLRNLKHLIKLAEGYEPEPPEEKEEELPLMLKSLQDGSTVKLETHSSYYNTYEVSFDNEVWESYTFGTDITLNEGDKVYFRCTYFTPSNNDNRYVQFVMSGKIEAYNNINSMYSSDFINLTKLTQEDVFYSLFDSCKSLYRAPVLPATSLSNACYAAMFSGCSNLVEAPKLPATTLATNCYASMFSGCCALTKAPELPATDLTTYCYYRMFRFCTNLAEVKCAAVNSPSGESSFVGACNDWLDDTSASGNFYADPSAVWTSDINGIPSGWTRMPL